MMLETILRLTLHVGVAVLVVGIGIRTRATRPLWLLLHKPALALRSVLAMYVALPAFVLLLIWLLPLQASVAAVLLGFALAPVLPPWAMYGAAVDGQDDYVIGVELLSASIALLLVPMFLWLVNLSFGVAAVLDPLAVEGVLLVTFAIPLAIGMGITQFFPNSAPRLGRHAKRIGGALVILDTVIVLVFDARAMLGVIRPDTLVATAAVVLFGLLAGHLLGGPDPGNRRALASATVTRHPAIAIVLASGAFPEHQSVVLGAVALYLIAALLITIPYERWRASIAPG